MPVTWESSSNASLIIWDIEREFQNASEAYVQWQARHRRRRSTWAWFGTKSRDDALRKALRLGRQVRKLIETGKATFGSRFEEGDSICHTILSAQLLRLQYEIRVPLYGKALSPTPTSIPYEEIITAAKGIRRVCLTALTEQYARFRSPLSTPILPPPCFKLQFCPFAEQLKKDLKKAKPSELQTKKLLPHRHHDDRELCPHCSIRISVTPHSGLPNYRSILFSSHTGGICTTSDDRATFACTSCHKTFDDSYAFLDHVFQKKIGSDKSCLGGSRTRWIINKEFNQSDSRLLDQCLKNCVDRELKRAKSQLMVVS
ncbi:hypothetical protein P153DRAFT_355824 [Dothidotthia symphoricarpi CBS 119687]|uniref:C2H2-type domain-containing protein n=1 Tax=Dothidotthia symphoricarpi CBS 119687 TaxID=1392245 RepID=A0A6A6AHK3_9PLEO|nr:uncharacterized protein P153DRAFT_355824 [Dothidotthia symphoricarpi CBS 119687]KAF2131036.1 hypothetical protein P153DRAFT_355824 [Dothidotthia symphoricarpi CBS 119687]